MVVSSVTATDFWPELPNWGRLKSAYHAVGVQGGRVSAKPTRRGGRDGAGYGRILIPPCGLAESRWQPHLAAICLGLLACVLLAELVTPTAVVSALGLIPVIVAAWTMSRRFAGVVLGAALLELGASLALEPANRMTMVVVGFAGFVLVVLTRLYARDLAGRLAGLATQGSATRPIPVSDWNNVVRFAGTVKALTRREQQVASLAARGFTAAEIGEQLHIGHRTVETHLAGIYSKLLIRSRRELIRMASAPVDANT
jgi:DNA-binding CsgD family transcriptional regulator